MGNSNSNTNTKINNSNNEATQEKNDNVEVKLPSADKKVEAKVKYPLVCDEKEMDIMSPKLHGTCNKPVMKNLKYGCEYETADRVCCFNRHYAEFSAYWQKTNFLNEVNKEGETTYYDSVSGKPLFIAPRGRTFDEFIKETKSHGWPSFRDPEVVWENVRCLTDGETVSLDGTHLGHNLPDRKGNRYCINLVSIAGNPIDSTS